MCVAEHTLKFPEGRNIISSQVPPEVVEVVDARSIFHYFFCLGLYYISNSVIKCLSHVVDVALVQPSNRNARRVCHVNVKML